MELIKTMFCFSLLKQTECLNECELFHQRYLETDTEEATAAAATVINKTMTDCCHCQ